MYISHQVELHPYLFLKPLTSIDNQRQVLERSGIHAVVVIQLQ